MNESGGGNGEVPKEGKIIRFPGAQRNDGDAAPRAAESAETLLRHARAALGALITAIGQKYQSDSDEVEWTEMLSGILQKDADNPQVFTYSQRIFKTIWDVLHDERFMVGPLAYCHAIEDEEKVRLPKGALLPILEESLSRLIQQSGDNNMAHDMDMTGLSDLSPEERNAVRQGVREQLALGREWLFRQRFENPHKEVCVYAAAAPKLITYPARAETYMRTRSGQRDPYLREALLDAVCDDDALRGEVIRALEERGHMSEAERIAQRPDAFTIELTFSDRHILFPAELVERIISAAITRIPKTSS